MIKNIVKIYFLVNLVLTLTNCDNHEFPKTPYPNVRTLPVKEISSSGATFTAELTNSGNSSILTHGFVWTQWENNNPEIGPNDSIGLGRLNGNGTFFYHLNNGLIINRSYYVRAYIKTKDYIVYGEEVTFICK
jgi:hypothetical protein